MLNLHQRRGFTLIELLVVISIIAILMAVLMPALQKARKQAKEVICASNSHQMSIAALSYENSNERLPFHYTENGGEALPVGDDAPLASWPDMIANTTGVDTRECWTSYIPDMKFFNCPMVKELDYNIDRVPLNSCRIYGGYQFVMGYMRNRTTDKVWGARWTKTSQKWMYEGKRFNVLACDKLYYSFSMKHYRINHGAELGIAYQFSDYEGPSTKWIGSMYEQYNVADKNLRQQTNAVYALTDGSVAKYDGDDEKLVEVNLPSDQDRNSGSMLLPKY
ncbi:MAG: type II secretion system protein [Sedimentisphaeraceae bacterium JB056]